MSGKYKEVCKASKWVNTRLLLVTLLFIGLALYFFYDWKIGYPKKNYHRAQYETFQKARDYFISHVKAGGDADQWRAFAEAQSIEHFQNTDLVENRFSEETWPQALAGYDLYKAEYEASSGADAPVMWDAFLTEQRAKVARLITNKDNSKEDGIALKKAIRWDRDLPTDFVKKDYEANYRLIMYKTFQEAQQAFEEFSKKGWGKHEWELYAAHRDLAYPTDKSVLPVAKQGDKWPEILTDYDRLYEKAKGDIETGVEVNEPYLWKEFTREVGLGESDHPDSFYEKKKVTEQLYFGIGMIVLSIISVLVWLWMKTRFMAVDDEAFYAPGGKRIPFTDIFKVDKRKWDNKGLAQLYYRDGGVEKKVRFDGMVYGGLSTKDGEPAEKVFQTIISNFKGEVIDYAEDDPEDEKIKD